MLFNDVYKIRSMERFLDLDVSRESELQNIVTLASEACQTSAAFMVFWHEGQLRYHFKYGFLADTLNVEQTFWDMPITRDQVLVIEDLSAHPQLHDHPLVKQEPQVRFYAGVPLITHDGQNIGSLYVLGQEAKPLSARRRRMLELLSHQAITMVEFELSMGVLREQYSEVKNAENKLRSFFESSKSSHLLVGRNLEIITFNKTYNDIAKSIFGRSITPGEPATDFIHPDYRTDFVDNVQKALQGESIQFERSINIQGLESRWAKLSYNPTYDATGYIFGVSFNSTDITERKLAEEKILRQNEALRKIAHMQSHELRKPVASILGLMNLLKLEETGCNAELLGMMERVVMDLDDMIHHIVRNTELHDHPADLPETF
ncbi:GAF domain-containing protein [Mucilaginibacter daejeonensis]|uniref:GAF domain-containing protein n=1 Tax=Mucilaginibacter daejeonensis TaxID=398049 RepID=UPI001D171C7C|nr:GAF domain-containing protein [Mucilaginibacter daejeonensis]UEG52224.1 GAF domain-containing protein [Mucilaginibacter daejeonensis]